MAFVLRSAGPWIKLEDGAPFLEMSNSIDDAGIRTRICGLYPSPTSYSTRLYLRGFHIDAALVCQRRPSSTCIILYEISKNASSSTVGKKYEFLSVRRPSRGRIVSPTVSPKCTLPVNYYAHCKYTVRT